MNTEQQEAMDKALEGIEYVKQGMGELKNMLDVLNDMVDTAEPNTPKEGLIDTMVSSGLKEIGLVVTGSLMEELDDTLGYLKAAAA